MEFTIGSVMIGFVLRMTEGLLAAAPTLLVGIMAAGCLRAMVPPQRIVALFGRQGWHGMVRAILLAPLLPVCSLGVLPVMVELRRAGVPAATVVTYAVAAAMLNPIALTYGITSLPLLQFAVLILLAVVTVLGAGMLTSWRSERLSASPGVAMEEVPVALSGLRRIANAGIASGRIATGPILGDLAIALGVSALVASLIPPDFLPDQMTPSGWLAPLWMLLAAFPAYISPATGMMQIIVLSRAQLSFGAASVLLLWGVGRNVALSRRLANILGYRRMFVLWAMMLLMCIGMGFVMDAIWVNPGESDTDIHALDTLAQPHSATITVLCEKVKEPAGISLLPLLALMLVGVVCRWKQIERLKDVPPSTSRNSAAGWWQRPLPRPLLALASVVLCGVLAIAMIYTYYPPVEQLFADMQVVRANAILSLQHHQKAAAIRELHSWDELAAKLPISATLRFTKVSPTATESTKAFRELLHVASKAASAPSPQDVGMKKLTKQICDTYSCCREAYCQTVIPAKRQALTP